MTEILTEEQALNVAETVIKYLTLSTKSGDMTWEGDGVSYRYGAWGLQHVNNVIVLTYMRQGLVDGWTDDLIVLFNEVAGFVARCAATDLVNTDRLWKRVLDKCAEEAHTV